MPASGTGRQDEVPSLPVLATKRLPESIRFPFTAYSHAHDLLAVVTQRTEVTVFRIVSSQVAFTIKRGKDSEADVTAVAWKADGGCLGVGWSDGSFEIYDGGSGRSLHTTHIKGGESDDVHEWRLYFPSQGRDVRGKEMAAPRSARKAHGTVGCFGWMGHAVGSRKMAMNGNGVGNGVGNGNGNDNGNGNGNGNGVGVGDDFTTDDWWYDEADEDGNGNGTKSSASGAMDLPRAIATLDITKVLPRLAAVPVSQTTFRPGPEGIKYATQATTDAVFDAQKEPDPDRVESLIVAQDDGTVDVLVDETVKIGSLSIRGAPVMHAAHPDSPSHVVLSQAAEGSGAQLIFIDLPLATFSGTVLHVIASNTKRIQSQLDYITYTLRCIEHDYNSGVELPNRYLGLLVEELENDDNRDPIFHFYHLAMTGTFNSYLLEWLKDVVRDTGLKRWELNVNTMYTNMSNHIFINLLPALDRITVAITTLRGYARLHDGSSKFDVPPQLFGNILEHVDSLRLVAQRMQLIIMTEHKQFRAFIKWLRLQLNIAIAGPSSHGALETEDREVPGMDYALVLAYIKHTLLDSKVASHILSRPGTEGPLDLKNLEEHLPQFREMSYEHSKEALLRLETLKDGETLAMRDVEDPMILLNIPALASALASSVRVALQRITQWQSRMLVAPTTVLLNRREETTFTDMNHISIPGKGEEPSTTTTRLLALHTNEPNKLEIISLARSPSITNNRRLTSSSTILHSPPALTAISHVFPDGTLISAKWIPHSPLAFLTLFRPSSGPYPHQVNIMKHTIISNGLCSETLHVFPVNFKAEEMTIGGRKGKVLCVVFGNGGREWRVLDLDARKGKEMEESGMETGEENS